MNNPILACILAMHLTQITTMSVANVYGITYQIKLHSRSQPTAMILPLVEIYESTKLFVCGFFQISNTNLFKQN